MSSERTKTIEKELSRQTRIRLFLAKQPGGGLTRWRVQLEHLVIDEWTQIVGSDHNPASETGHNVTREGVHLDIYRDGNRIDREILFESTDPATALTIAETHMKENFEEYVREYRQWLKTRNNSGRSNP